MGITVIASIITILLFFIIAYSYFAIKYKIIELFLKDISKYGRRNRKITIKKKQ